MEQRHWPEKIKWFVFAALIAAATVAAYSNSLHGPFIYDDKPSLLSNPTITHLWPIWDPLSPPARDGMTVGGRPLLNLSLALNYAMGGLNVTSYHVTNLVIHIVAALVLFALIFRAVKAYSFFHDVGLQQQRQGALFFAGSIALLWAVHPLATESVTYIVQRAESLAGLFFLLTLYCFVRGTEGPKPGPWLWLSLVCALLGATAKETLATVPFVVLLFDRAFVARSFQEAWARRRGYYLSFLLLWLELALLVASTGGDRGGSIGFGVSRSWWAYGMTQFEAITRYVGLCLWPTSLVFDYGQISTPDVSEIVPYVLIVLTLVGISIWALIRHPALGFLAATFFIILGPTSSIIPGASQMIVEHRVYLSLIAVIALAVTGVYSVIGPWTVLIAAGLAVVLGLATHRRNYDYRSEGAIWQAVTRDFPTNADAWNNIASVTFMGGDPEAAKQDCLRAIALKPELVPAHYNLGKCLFALHDFPGAITAYKRAIELRPTFTEAHNNLGVTYLNVGDQLLALQEFKEAIRLEPDFPEALENAGITEEHLGRDEAAIITLRRAIAVGPRSVNAHNALGNVLLREKRYSEARAEYEFALRGDPKSPAITANLGNVCLLMNKPTDAIGYYVTALKADPTRADVAGNIGNAYLALGHAQDALAFFQASLAANPNAPETHFAYANALAMTGRLPEAKAQLREVLRLRPDTADAQARLKELERSR